MLAHRSSSTDFKQQFKKRCFSFSLSVLNITEKLLERRVNRVMTDQLIRSSTSIGANVVEGSNGSSKREFINYFQIALKSSAESLYWLALLKEINQEQTKVITDLIQECTEIRRILTTIILNTKHNSKL